MISNYDNVSFYSLLTLRVRGNDWCERATQMAKNACSTMERQTISTGRPEAGLVVNIGANFALSTTSFNRFPLSSSTSQMSENPLVRQLTITLLSRPLPTTREPSILNIAFPPFNTGTWSTRMDFEDKKSFVFGLRSANATPWPITGGSLDTNIPCAVAMAIAAGIRISAND